MVEMVTYNVDLHKLHLVDLNIKHLSWVAEELLTRYKLDMFSGMDISVKDYVEASIDVFEKYTPPEGVYYLLKMGHNFGGMGALRKLTGDIGEIKRMYIDPQFRGLGYGKNLLGKLMQMGEKIGFKKIFLDTGDFMKAAQHIYKSVGFREREIYPETEVPLPMQKYWLFMEKVL